MYLDELFKNNRDVSLQPFEDTSLFPVCFGDCFIEIQTNYPEISHSITCLYGTLLAPERFDRQPVSVRYCLYRENDHYIAARNNKFAFSSESLSKTVSRFDWMLMSDIVDYNHRHALIHASAVARDNIALVLAGLSGSGKSSLALLLCLEGWQFITDDVVLLQNGVRGIPRAFCLAENLAEKLINNAAFVKGFKKGKPYRYIDPRCVHITLNAGVASPGYIIFLEKTTEQHKLMHIAPAMGSYLLAENLFDTDRYFEQKLNTLSDVMLQVRGAALKWHDLAAAFQEIKQYLTPQRSI